MKKIISIISIFILLFSLFAIPSSASYSDLSNTKWKGDIGWKAQSGYGWHDLNGTITVHNYSSDNLPAYDLNLSLLDYELGVGYKYQPTDVQDFVSTANNIVLVPKNFTGTNTELKDSIFEFNNSFAFTLHIMGGNDASNPSLRGWLQNSNNGVVDITNPYVEYTYQLYDSNGNALDYNNGLIHAGPLVANKNFEEFHVVQGSYDVYEWNQFIIAHYVPNLQGTNFQLNVPEGDYLIASTGTFDLTFDASHVGAYGYDTLGIYNYDNVSRTWQLFKLIDMPTGDGEATELFKIIDEQYLIWTKDNLYSRGSVFYTGDPNFPHPLTEGITEVIRQVVQKVTAPTVVKTMMTITLCGVGLLALLIILKTLPKTLSKFLLT